MRLKKYILWSVLCVSFFSCKDAYRPDIISTEQSHLVVEGVLVIGGPTQVSLTRSTKLYSGTFTPVANAIVTVEGRDNSTRSLNHVGAGNYQSPDLNLTANNDYRLRIRTADGKEYLSEYVTAKLTPAIDSIGWKREANGDVRIYVNTDDPSGNTRYYKWNYDETWEIHSMYYSRYIWTGNGVRERIMPQEEVYYCWKYDYPTSILVGSSAKLQTDVIFQQPLNLIEKNSEKLAIRYSILVRQFAIDKKAYEFYELMKKNTESLGTIFDAQPSEIRGNITCVNDPGELVIGFITSSSVTEKRIFIEKTELPDWLFYQNCPSQDIANHPDSLRDAYATGGLAPIDANFHMTLPGVIVSYWSSAPACVDCTQRGGNLTKPSFW